MQLEKASHAQTWKVMQKLCRVPMPMAAVVLGLAAGKNTSQAVHVSVLQNNDKTQEERITAHRLPSTTYARRLPCRQILNQPWQQRCQKCSGRLTHDFPFLLCEQFPKAA